MRKLKKCNLELEENLKKLRNEVYEKVSKNKNLENELENVKIENVELKENLMLFDEIKKENADLGKKVKFLEQDNKILKSTFSVCDVAYSTKDLVFYSIPSSKDEGKKTFACIDGNCYDDNNGFF